jgi:hypothetical protein
MLVIAGLEKARQSMRLTNQILWLADSVRNDDLI